MRTGEASVQATPTAGATRPTDRLYCCRPYGHPLYVHLTPVTDLPDQEMHQWEQQHLAPGCHEVSDGTRAFAQVCQAQSTHERHLTGGGRQGAQAPPLRWVNAVLGNLKTCLPCDPDC